MQKSTTKASQPSKEPSSFRDPSGWVYTLEGTLYRQVNLCYRASYDQLMSSGLYTALVKERLLIPHQEVADAVPLCPGAYKIIQPERIAFVSYPYEWCFGQYRAAALTTLRIQRIATDHGMSLKDASAYNVQFHQGRAVFIDTLSFVPYREGSPWHAYGQFCRHFLAPLMLYAGVDPRLSTLMQTHIDGIPLDLASRLLKGTRGIPGAYRYIHMHAWAIRKYQRSDPAGSPASGSKKIPTVQRFSYIALIDSLISVVEKLRLPHRDTEWGDYYNHTNYQAAASDAKATILQSFLDAVAPKSLWDLGGNDGRYARLASSRGIHAVCFDADREAVEACHRNVQNWQEQRLLPLFLDLFNPSPAIGFANRERQTLAERGRPEMITMLAVIHHLVISNNIPMESLADWLAELAPWLVLEFVPKEDSQVVRLLATRDDIFPQYTAEGFEAAFSLRFAIYRKELVVDSARTMYLLQRIEAKDDD